MMQDTSSPQFMVLGAVRAHPAGGGEPHRLGSPQQQAMLAILLLRAGQPVSLSELIEGLWGRTPPPTASSIVRKHAWRLRRVLDAASGPERLLTSVGDGYRLTLAPLRVDALQAESLAAAARRLITMDNVAAAHDRLLEALQLWQGEPLAGVPGPFAKRSRDRLVELRVSLLDERWELELAQEQPHAAIPALTETIAAHPVREHSYALLMRALFAAGRQQEALATFADARRRLGERHGLQPGSELTEVHRRILHGESTALPRPREELSLPGQRPAWHDQQPLRPLRPLRPLPEPHIERLPVESPPAVAATDPPAPIATPVPAQLPPDLPDFTGRAPQTAELVLALTSPDRHAPAVVAVTGMGGVGKTALAVHVAHQVRSAYPDGQLHVDLASVDGTADGAEVVLGALLSGLGVAATAWPDGCVERSGLVRSLLNGRRVLITLDNAWDPAAIRDAIPGSAGCGVLITGRVRMDGLPLTTQLRLDIFQPDEAMDLLGRSIGADRLADDKTGAVTLVAACGHLPLAIRIAAARLAARPSWTMGALAERLGDERRRMAELRAGALAVESTFELSYRHLTADQIRSLGLLARCAAAEVTPAEAAEMLGGDQEGAERALEGLVDAAMMESPEPGRYRYHDLVRGYARLRALAEPPAPDLDALS
jgi:DNA-binding SARP family transcriptional activator